LRPQQIRDRLKGRVAIVGVGNRLRGDDAAGPELIRRLESSQLAILDSELFLIDVGEVPENFLQKIAGHKPDVILLVDAVNFQRSPGSVEIIELDAVGEQGLSTHHVSLKLAMMYLKEETEADVFILGIQPRSLEMHGGLSEPVEQAINQIERELLNCIERPALWFSGSPVVRLSLITRCRDEI
jgi:hydrogenase 3 maturation protease